MRSAPDGVGGHLAHSVDSVWRRTPSRPVAGVVNSRTGPARRSTPPQSTVTQTRDLFEAYADAGGGCEELVVEDVGHSPHDEVLSALTTHLDG